MSHFFLVKAYSHLSAVEVQPIVYLQLVLSIMLAIVFFDEKVIINMLAGAMIVVGAGVFTIWREYRANAVGSGTGRRLIVPANDQPVPIAPASSQSKQPR